MCGSKLIFFKRIKKFGANLDDVAREYKDFFYSFNQSRWFGLKQAVTLVWTKTRRHSPKLCLFLVFMSIILIYNGSI